MSGRNSLPIKLADSAFKPNHSAESNHVFLWEASSEPPFMRAVPGWKIVGYGKAPWPKTDWPLAVMFERTEPATEPYGNSHGDEMTEGTRIWQHGRAEWVPGYSEEKDAHSARFHDQWGQYAPNCRGDGSLGSDDARP